MSCQITNFAHKFEIMKRNILYILLAGVVFCSCGSQAKVLMSADHMQKYEAAKKAYASGNYARCTNLLADMVAVMKGTDKAQESLYMMAMAQYNMGDYETASTYFKQFYASYPKGEFSELARYNSGKSLYNSVPDPRLDQSSTSTAITELQSFLDFCPGSEYAERAQNMIFELQDKLVEKEYISAKLYFDLGTYFGNSTEQGSGSNYDACITTCQNTLKDYPYTKFREDLYYLNVKAKYELAKQSVDEKKDARYRDAIDEYFGFKNEFPESKYTKEVDQIYAHAIKRVDIEKTEED